MFEKVYDMLSVAVPVRVIERPESLTIMDYRPTWVMALAGGGFMVMLGLFVFFAINLEHVGYDPFPLFAFGLLAAGCLIFALRGSLREVYYFDKSTDSYRFVRRFVHRKEVIEGSLDQFCWSLGEDRPARRERILLRRAQPGGNVPDWRQRADAA